MKNKKSRIPDFKSIEEEAHFWDTHSVTDFADESEDVDIVFDLDKDALIARAHELLSQK